MLERLTAILAQDTPPWEEPVKAAPKVPVNHNAIDLSRGFNQIYNGEVSESTFRNGMLAVVGVIVVLAIIIHYRDKRKQAKVLDSQFKLGWELCKLVPFPFGSRVILWWVARSSKLPVATLLISSKAFDRAVNEWSSQPTFSLLRQWGKSRLLRLQPILFN